MSGNKEVPPQGTPLLDLYEDFVDFQERATLFFETIGTLALGIDGLSPDTASGIVRQSEVLKSEVSELRQELKQAACR